MLLQLHFEFHFFFFSLSLRWRVSPLQVFDVGAPANVQRQLINNKESRERQEVTQGGRERTESAPRSSSRASRERETEKQRSILRVMETGVSDGDQLENNVYYYYHYIA